LEENEKLRHDKVILMDNYGSLMDKVDDLNKVENRANSSETVAMKENEDLKNDLKMLKILVFRLNKHLDYYQEAVSEKELKFDPPSTYSNEKEITSSWAVNSHLLAPLMNSYEERIREKNEIIKGYETELNQFTVKLKKILEENERVQGMYENLNHNSEFWLTEKQRLTSQCDILKNKAAIHAKRADLAKEKLMEILKVYEQKVQSQSLDIERLQEAYNRSKGEITTLKNFQKNPDAVKESVRECQKSVCLNKINVPINDDDDDNFSRLLEELKQQFEVEKGQLVDEKNNLNSQMNQHREKTNELETLLEKQKLCNEYVKKKKRSSALVYVYSLSLLPTFIAEL
jgi:centrosomal protein CEP89